MYERTGKASWSSIMGVVLVTITAFGIAVAAHKGWVSVEGTAQEQQSFKQLMYAQAVICPLYCMWKLRRNFSKVGFS